MPITSIPKIGLALSGGAARGIAHIAVLDTLELEGIPIHAIAGTSAGSIIGALYAAGMPLLEIKRIILKTTWTDILKFNVPRRGLISSEGIYRFMDSILPVKKFSSLLFPFAAVATDLRTGEKVSITTGSVARAVQASCSLPVVFTPTEINKRLLVDGGVVSQIPVRTAREELGAAESDRRERELQCAGNGGVRQHHENRGPPLRPLGVEKCPGGRKARGRASERQRKGHLPATISQRRRNC